MEGERRKRKLENEVEEESEEQKMEKFFALIKSTKDARDRLSNKENKKKEGKSSNNLVWNPTFQPEDFIDDDNLAIRMIPKEVAEKELLALPQEEDTVVVPVGATGIASDENIGNKKKASGEDVDDLELTLSM